VDVWSDIGEVSAAHAVLGKFAREMLFGGRRVRSAKAMEAGSVFAFPDLQPLLRQFTGTGPALEMGVNSGFPVVSTAVADATS
jgi:Domain of unknown function (DUF1731)